MKSLSSKKPARVIITIILAAVLVAVNLPFTATAAVDDCFEDGDLMCMVTKEGEGNEPGEIMVAFNENLDPKDVKIIIVPEYVYHNDKKYNVTELSSSAFGGCTALEKLYLSGSTFLESIGEGAFYDCKCLTEIVITCDFDKTMFENTGVYPDGDKYTVEYMTLGADEQPEMTRINGKFSYTHNWVPDENNSNQHICTRCQLTGDHYFAMSAKGSVCDTCGFPNPNPVCDHDWKVLPKTIAADTAQYECAICATVEEQKIGVGASNVSYNGQQMKVILQDPYKVLPDGTQLKTTTVEPGSARYNELMSQMDYTYKNMIENIAFFELELYNAQGESISGEIAGKVRVLIQIPEGWDKSDLEAVLVMAGADIDVFEESIITIDGVDYLAFWTDHFSPYAMIDKQTQNDKTNADKKSPATGNPTAELITAFTAASVSAAVITFISFERKRRAL